MKKEIEYENKLIIADILHVWKLEPTNENLKKLRSIIAELDKNIVYTLNNN